MKQYLSYAWQDPNTQFDSELGWSPVLNRSINYPGWGRLSSNSHGFRSAEINENKKQIIVLGDSISWGAGVSDTETFPYYLENLISSSGYQVSNLAVPGYDIGQYYLFLKRHINEFNNLKQVILVICTYNDLQDTGRNICYGKRKPLFIVKNNDLILMHTIIKKYCLRNLFSKSYFLSNYPSYESNFGMLLNTIVGDKILGPHESKEISLILLKKICELTFSHGAKLLIVVSPAKNDFTEKSFSLTWFESVFDRPRPKYLGYIDYIETLRNIDQKELDNIYSKQDEVHFSQKGNLFLAKTVYEYLQKY